MKIINLFLSGDVFIGCSAFMLFFIMVFCVYDMNKINDVVVPNTTYVQDFNSLIKP